MAELRHPLIGQLGGIYAIWQHVVRRAAWVCRGRSRSTVRGGALDGAAGEGLGKALGQGGLALLAGAADPERSKHGAGLFQ